MTWAKCNKLEHIYEDHQTTSWANFKITLVLRKETIKANMKNIDIQ